VERRYAAGKRPRRRFRRDPLADPKPLIRRVYGYVAYRLGDGPEAEDVTGTVFEHAVRYADSYNEARGQPLPWLIGIARRCIAQALAERKERALQLADAPDGTDFEAELIERLTLDTALLAISERDRELIALRYGADLPTRQIGNLLGLTDSAVDVGIHRARIRLRAALEQEQRKADLAARPETTRPIDVRKPPASVLLK